MSDTANRRREPRRVHPEKDPRHPGRKGNSPKSINCLSGTGEAPLLSSGRDSVSFDVLTPQKDR